MAETAAFSTVDAVDRPIQQVRFIVAPRGSGQVLADLYSWNICFDRLEFTTNFDRRIRFKIECLQMTWPAIQPNEDA